METYFLFANSTYDPSLMMIIMFETFMLLKMQRLRNASFCNGEAWGILSVRYLSKWTEFASHIDLSRSANSDHRLAHHLSPVSNPPKTACDGKDNTEHVLRTL